MAIFRRCLPAELAPDLGVPLLNVSLADVGDNGGGGDSPTPERFLPNVATGGVVECGRMLQRWIIYFLNLTHATMTTGSSDSREA